MIDTAAAIWRRAARAAAAMRPLAPALAITAVALVVSGCGGSSGAASSGGRPSTVTVVVQHHHRADGSGGRRSGHGHGGARTAASGHGQATGRGRHAGTTGTSTKATRTTATAAAAASTRTGADAGAAAPKRRAAARVQPTAVAVVERVVAMRSAPGHAGHVLGRLATRTQFGSRTAVPVVQRRGAWLGVTSLLAGNNRLGWIPRSAVSLSRTGWRIYLSIGRQRITISYGGEVVNRFETSTGVVGASTPTGHFAVTDRLRTGVEYGPYGCCILALSAVQPRHLSDWDGGDRIAIHATNDTADLGRPASHGCAHVDDADGHWLLAHIPDGTPVVIENPPFHRGRGSPA
jgi:lipoprotein-anchoring transpeptidase ErfK/SrfK